MLVRVLIAGLLLAHAAIHVAFIAPPPPATAGGPAWPFTTDDSWLLTRVGVDADTSRLLAGALFAVTMAAFALAAVVAIGIAPAGLWLPAATIGALGSLALLVAFFHPWLVVGLAIDVVLLWATLIAAWSPTQLGLEA
jgi:hypothetical protein